MSFLLLLFLATVVGTLALIHYSDPEKSSRRSKSSWRKDVLRRLRRKEIPIVCNRHVYLKNGLLAIVDPKRCQICEKELQSVNKDNNLF